MKQAHKPFVLKISGIIILAGVLAALLLSFQANGPRPNENSPSRQTVPQALPVPVPPAAAAVQATPSALGRGQEETVGQPSAVSAPRPEDILAAATPTAPAADGRLQAGGESASTRGAQLPSIGMAPWLLAISFIFLLLLMIWRQLNRGLIISQ